MEHIKKIKNELKSNGYVVIRGFFSEIKEFKDFNLFLKKFIRFSLREKNNKIKKFDKALILKFKKNKKISSFLNDTINLSPSINLLLSSNKLISQLSKIFGEKKEKIILNNTRFRIQIPGNDDIANLPWHQDSHYNLIKNTQSIVAWVSLGNINKKMGPIIFKKGSHKFGSQKKNLIKKANGGKAYKVNFNKPYLKNLKNIQLETQAGDLILIDMNTIHTSGVNMTDDKIKYSAQARYHVVKSNLLDKN